MRLGLFVVVLGLFYAKAAPADTPDCEPTMLGLPQLNYTAEERAAAAQLISWISYTHPMLHRIFRSAPNYGMRVDFTHIPTGFLLVPWPGHEQSYRFYEHLVKFKVPFWRRSWVHAEFERRSRWMAGRNRPEHLPLDFEANFAARVVEQSASLLHELTLPSARREGPDDPPTRYLHLKKNFPIWDDLPGRMTVRILWLPDMRDHELEYLSRIVERTRPGRVRDLVIESVQKHFPAIAAAQQTLLAHLDGATTNEGFSEYFDIFLKSSEYREVAHLAVPDDLPEMIPSAAALPNPPEKPVEVCDQAPFSSQAIETFLSSSSQARAVPITGGSLEQMSREMSRAIDLFSSTLTQLTPWSLDDPAWTRLRSEFEPTRIGLDRLSAEITRYRGHASNAREQFESALGATRPLSAWVDHRVSEIAKFVEFFPEGLSASEQDALRKVVRDLPRLQTTAGSVLAMLELRLALMDQTHVATTDLMLILTQEKVTALAEPGGRGVGGHVREALNAIANTSGKALGNQAP